MVSLLFIWRKQNLGCLSDLLKKLMIEPEFEPKAFQCPKSQNFFFLPSLLSPFLLLLLSHSWCFSKIQNRPKINSLPLQKLDFSIMGEILYSGNQQILYRSHEKMGPILHYSDPLFYMDHPALPICSPGSFYFMGAKIYSLKTKVSF